MDPAACDLLHLPSRHLLDWVVLCHCSWALPENQFNLGLAPGLCVRAEGDVVKPAWRPVQKTLDPKDKLTIGIVGFGLFGQFLARRMVLAGHRVVATSRSPYQKEAEEMGVEYFT